MKTKTLVILGFFMFAITLVIFAMPYGYAMGVYTAKEDGTITATFRIGEKVRIIADAPTPYNIIVADPQVITRYIETSLTIKYDKTLSGLTDKIGKWEVRITPLRGSTIVAITSAQYTTAIANVVPEIPFGTLSMLLAFSAAFGISIFWKRNKPKLVI